ncbi:hypothetical protein LPJ72_001236 [Coemansia sp. Benny D160-2]|nr:hypothetical protein LPJ72_001236 [Coemansia sp. Benny D160-2]
MGQPRVRLVSKEVEDASDNPQQTPPRGNESTAPSTSRSKRARKSDGPLHADKDGSGENTLDDYSDVKEECLRLYQAIKEMEKDGELLCKPFNKLPPKKDYPDYYAEIKKPIALDIIKGKITRGVTTSVSDFIADVDLMCSNAQTYNMPESYIYEAAGDIRDHVHKLASVDGATTSNPSAGLKLRIRKSVSGQSHHSAEAGISHGSDNAKASGHATKLSKRKRDLDEGSDSEGFHEEDDVGEDDDGDTGGDNEGAQKADRDASAKSKGERAEGVLDGLFQAIYDADLTKATRLLKTPDLPVNGYRKVVMKDADGEEIDNDEYTWAPLHAAACYGRLKVAQILCEKGANIEAMDTMHKSTPLSWAAYTGRKRLAKYLVRIYHADVNARNAHGQLPIEIAMDPGNPLWAEFLLPTDGTKVDLPEPLQSEDKAVSHEPKKTPSRKARLHSVEGAAQSQAHGISVTHKPPTYPPSPFASQFQTQSPSAQISTGGPPIPQCIGGIGHQETTHPKMADAMLEIVNELCEIKDSDGERIVEPFEELPDKDEYPEYFEVIVHPMAFNMIKDRIKAGYRSFDAFNYDILWIFNNATFFNEAESDIYQYAVTLEKEYKRICHTVIEKYNIPFDTSYIDAVPPEGRYVSRVTTGDNDLFVGDFFYVKSGTGRSIAMINKIRVGGVSDRRKYIDGHWLLTPAEVPELAGQPVYPHQLFVGPSFEGLGVRGICGKCYVLLPNVYTRVYPQGFLPADLYICESKYEPSTTVGESAALLPLTNWAHEFKTPLMKPPTFIPYIVPFVPSKQAAALWNNTSLLPHLGLTVLNRDAAARAQAQARMNTQPQTQVHSPAPSQPQLRPGVPNPVAMQTPIALNQQGQSAIFSPPGAIRPQTGMQFPVNGQQPILTQGGLTQAYQMLVMNHQQNMTKAQAQFSHRESAIRKQFMDQITMAQQQNPGFIGSVHHQALMKQQSQLVEQSQQAYLAQVQQLQQLYNNQMQAINQTMQQQKQQVHSGASQAGLFPQQISAMHPTQTIGAAYGISSPTAMSLGPAMNQMAITSPHSVRPVNGTMAAPMSPLGQMQMSLPVAASMATTLPMASLGMNMMGSPQAAMIRPGMTMSPALLPQGAGSTDGTGFNAILRPSTPSMPSSSVIMSHPGMPLPSTSVANAHTMMAMLLQQQQQQQQQQQPNIPKQTHTPLSPDMSSVNGHHALSQNGSTMSSPTQSSSHVLGQLQSQDAIELWKKSTRIFVSYGNQRIAKGLAIQIATPNASMFMHVCLSSEESNHALQVPSSTMAVLLRPVPGPFNANGKVLLSLSANGRRLLPRVIPDSLNHQQGENSPGDDAPSHASDEVDKDDSGSTSLLAKSAGYAYEVALQSGMNVVDIEALASEWQPDALFGESGDQQVPPALPTQESGQKKATQHYSLFLTR